MDEKKDYKLIPVKLSDEEIKEFLESPVVLKKMKEAEEILAKIEWPPGFFEPQKKTDLQ